MKNPVSLGVVQFANNSGAKFYPSVRPDATVAAKTAAYTVLPADMGTVITNGGSSGTLAFTLPAAKDCTNQVVRFACLAAQIMRPTPVSGESVFLNGSGVASKYINLAAVIGNYVDLYSDGTAWLCTAEAGVITKEP